VSLPEARPEPPSSARAALRGPRTHPLSTRRLAHLFDYSSLGEGSSLRGALSFIQLKSGGWSGSRLGACPPLPGEATTLVPLTKSNLAASTGARPVPLVQDKLVGAAAGSGAITASRMTWAVGGRKRLHQPARA